ncbi:MAG: DUF1501 domain-containing protein, partial [Pseudomonadota bacterium]|nr:DUF1501 domain-containing protein [Pseudomonadota bacterium]
FIMLDGGNDSFNMLVPRSTQHYQQYRKTRSNLALSQSQLLPLEGFEDADGRRFGVHHSMPELAQLFSEKRLSFVANIAPMIRRISKQEFYNNSAPLPVGLLSHSDQFKHWQTSRPGERINRGWFGSFADVLQHNRPVKQISMNVSLAGSNIMQNGVNATHYSIKKEGSVGLEVNETKNDLNDAILYNFEKLLNHDYSHDPFKQAYLAITREAQGQHETFKQATHEVRIDSRFSDSDLSQQLRKVAQTIKASIELGMPQQTFFLRYIGWDHHDELLQNQERMLRVVSKALAEFQASLDELKLADRVITFTGSDFGRTLTSNGNGTDHGWGGNTLVMGNPVRGGKVLGQYPDLELGSSNPLDAGDGVLIPTTATDELYAELAMWFGVAKSDLPQLFPNIGNFYDINSSSPPLGVIA